MASLLVPLGLWRPSLAAALDVSCAAANAPCRADLDSQGTGGSRSAHGANALFLGLRHGGIVVLELEDGRLQTTFLLAGHATPIVALCPTHQPADQPAGASRDAHVLVSLAAGGDVALWALDEDGRCLLHNTMACGQAGDARGMVLAGAFAVVWGGSPGAPVVSVLRLATLEVSALAVLSPPTANEPVHSPPADDRSPPSLPSDRQHAGPSSSLDTLTAPGAEGASAIKKSVSLDASALSICKSAAALDVSRPPSTSSEATGDNALPGNAMPSQGTPRPSRCPSVGTFCRGLRPETAAAAGALACAGVWLASLSTALLFGPGAVHVVAVDLSSGTIVGTPRTHVLVDDASAIVHVRHACVSPDGTVWAADSRVLYAVDPLGAAAPLLRPVWRAPSPIAQVAGSHLRLCNGSVYTLDSFRAADTPRGDHVACIPAVQSLVTLFKDAPSYADVALTPLGAVCYDAHTVRLCPLPPSGGAVVSASLDKEGIAGITCTAVWERGTDARLVHGMADGSIAVRPLLDAACVPSDTLSSRPSGSASPAEHVAAAHAWSLALPSSSLLPSHSSLPEGNASLSTREIAHIDAPSAGEGLSASHRLSVVDCRGEEVVLPHVHRRAVTALAIDTRGRLASGDAAGAVVLWAPPSSDTSASVLTCVSHAAGFEPRHTFHVHAAPIVALVAVRTAAPSISEPPEAQMAVSPAESLSVAPSIPGAAGHAPTHVVIDADGGVSFVLESVLIGVVPPRSGRPPVVLVRWTLDRRVALFYRDGVVRVWSLATLTAQDVPARDDLVAFAFYQEIPAHPSLAAGIGAVHASAVVCNGLLGQALVWRTDAASSGACGLRDARAQSAMLDVRRVIETLRSRIVDKSSDLSRAHASNTLLFVLGLLIPWGADAAIDAAARDAGVRPPRADISVAMVGANGNTSYSYFPSKRSATMDATLRIACAAVLSVPLDVGPQWARLASLFLGSPIEAQPAPVSVRFPLAGGSAIRDTPGPSESGTPPCVRSGHALHLPSLSFASKYWHDQCDEIRTAARAVVARTLEHMPPADLEHIVAYWAELLPVDDAPDAIAPPPQGAPSGRRKMNRAAVILGIVALHRGEALGPHMRRRVSDSLLALLTDERRNLFRSAAIELIGRGYASVWAPHIDAPPVFRLLHTWLASVSHVVGARHGDAARPTSLGVYEASVSGDASMHALTVSGIARRQAPPVTQPAHEGDVEGVQLVVPFENEAAVATLEAVRTTLVQLGRDAPHRVLPTWVGGPEYAGSRSLVERWTGAALLTEMLRAPDAALRFGGLALLFVEAALRLLDTSAAAGLTALSGPASRARLLACALPLIAETCRVFPTVCYDAISQRIIASADSPAASADVPDGRIRIYDLRTAGSGASPSVHAAHPPLCVDCRVVDGHTRPATAVCSVGLDTGAWLADTQDGRGDAPPARAFPRQPPPYASVVSYSFGEATLRWWHVSSSASSAGSSSVPANAPPGTGPAGGRLVATDVVDPALTEAVVRHAAGGGSDGVAIGFRWHADRLQILVGPRVVCTVRIPAQ